MTWATRFRVSENLRGSLWVVPLIGGVLGGLLGALGVLVDQNVDLPSYWEYSSSTASTTLAAIVGAMATVTGFVVTVTVLVVQMATGTFSARYMRLWYRDRMLKVTLALMIGTLTFSFALLRQIETNFVPNLGVTIAGSLVFLSLLMFVVFLDRYLHRLRPVAVAAFVAGAGRRAFEEAVRLSAAEDAPDLVTEPYRPVAEPALVVHSSRAGSIQAVDANGLVKWAREHDCLLALPHAVGDFVHEGAPLVNVYGRMQSTQAAESRLRGMVALGQERTIQQDPAFAIRVMVDVAAKALSAAVNDPTTAVQVLDHLGEVLRLIGSTDLRASTEPLEPRPGRVVIQARRWEDFLALGVTEIRLYGATTIQVHRRLRALLEELREEVRPEHRAAVEDELARLDASSAHNFATSADLDRARAGDRQGMGGPAEAPTPRRKSVYEEAQT
ncbi:MAG: DUF2254 domain-containing protein [Candidatus Rokuibacteriota bacterium]|nr:MAG: DUF2254 domain-containing protein [Candidatus Rokubacteria bacterium]